jgi:hypothetical protein
MKKYCIQNRRPKNSHACVPLSWHLEIIQLLPVLRIQCVYPGPGARLLIFYTFRTRRLIPDPKTATKEKGEKISILPFSLVTSFTNKNILFLNRYGTEKIFQPIDKVL